MVMSKVVSNLIHFAFHYLNHYNLNIDQQEHQIQLKNIIIIEVYMYNFLVTINMY
jgi:hypothetical protein